MKATTLQELERKKDSVRISPKFEVESDKDKPSFPEIKNFYDVIENKASLLKAIKRNPDKDVIYHFPTLYTHLSDFDNENNKIYSFPKEFAEAKWDWCVAGSKAIQYSTSFLKDALDFKMRQDDNYKKKDLRQKIAAITKLNFETLNDKQFENFIRDNVDKMFDPETRSKVLDLLNNVTVKLYGEFTPNDTDIFFLNSQVNHRMVLPGIDFVHTKAKTVEELLLNFDLPCCRAAFNSKYDFWISAQCLSSILTGQYYLPRYLTNAIEFSKILATYRSGKGMDNDCEKLLFKRIIERMKKYDTRGFKCILIDTEEVQPWIKNRFHYGEWKCEKESEAIMGTK